MWETIVSCVCVCVCVYVCVCVSLWTTSSGQDDEKTLLTAELEDLVDTDWWVDFINSRFIEWWMVIKYILYF